MPKLSKATIAKAFDEGDNANTAAEKGAALEKLLAYLFSKVPGVYLHDKNVRDVHGSEEIDLVFWNAREPDGLSFLPNILLFECKNWSAPVDSQAVVYFINKVQTRHLGFGFLIAAAGITGNEGELSAAYQHLTNALVQHDIKILVMDRQELCALGHTDVLIELLQRKITNMVLRSF